MVKGKYNFVMVIFFKDSFKIINYKDMVKVKKVLIIIQDNSNKDYNMDSD